MAAFAQHGAEVISIHALLAESDGKLTSASGLAVVFLSTLSLRRATADNAQNVQIAIFLSTLSLRRATGGCWTIPDYLMISIHALLAESDRSMISAGTAPANFYPRSPCGERHVTVEYTPLWL